MNKKPAVTFCRNCTLPSSSAVQLLFDDNGVCSACSTKKEAETINWNRREALFLRLIEDYKSKDGGKTWTNIKRHENDASLNQKGATHTWEISTKETETIQFFSLFRILQTGFNSNRHYVSNFSFH